MHALHAWLTCHRRRRLLIVRNDVIPKANGTDRLALVDLKAMNAACQQRPTIGGSTSITLDYDLYATSTKPTAASQTSASIFTISATVTATNASSSTSRGVQSEHLGLGLGLGIGLGCVLIGSTCACVIIQRRKTQHQGQEAGTEPRSNNPRGWTNKYRQPMEIVEAHPSDVCEVGSHERVKPELSVPDDVPELANSSRV